MNKLICPQCGSVTSVIKNARSPDGKSMGRSRQCENGHIFSTIEKPVEDKVIKGFFYFKNKKNNNKKAI